MGKILPKKQDVSPIDKSDISMYNIQYATYDVH